MSTKRKYLHTDLTADQNAAASIENMAVVLHRRFIDEIAAAEARYDEVVGTIGDAAADAKRREELKLVATAYRAARDALAAALRGFPCVQARLDELYAKARATEAREDARQQRHLDKIGLNEALAFVNESPAN